MRFHLLIVLCVVLLCMLQVSCQKLDTASSGAPTLKMATLESLDKIPAAYGRLVSVTSSDSYPGWAQLWFEKADAAGGGDITCVYLSFITGQMRQNVLNIPRK